MKRSWPLIPAVAILALLMAWGAPLAAAAPRTDPPGTPGAKATAKASERAGREQARGAKEHFMGVIAVVDASSLTLTLDDGGSQAFLWSTDTRIQLPGSRGGAAWDSLVVGARASVQSARDGSGTLTALRVMQVPGKPVHMHRVGLVTAFQPGASITVQDRQGQSTTYTLDSETKILPAGRADSLAVGSWVTVIAPRNPASPEPSARGIVVHPTAPGP